MPGDTERDASNETNLLGDASFDIFWAGTGLKILMNIVNTEPELLTQCIIIGDNGKKYTVTEFLDNINKLKVRVR
jgi:hypothetical protein